MSIDHDGRAVLLTGVYGSGKSSVAEEMADLLEHRGVRYAAIDLDWLFWFHPGTEDAGAPHRMLRKNLRDVVANYLAAGVRRYVLAGSVRDRAELDGLRAELPMPLAVVRLVVPIAEIERRLASSGTVARVRDDLREAAEWIESSTGEGLEDLTVENQGRARDTAAVILDRLGWISPGPSAVKT